MPTALIVEDEPEANKLLSILVQLRGYTTSSVYTGGEAIASIERDPPDVVLLDLMLPDMNGFEVCDAVKVRKDTTLIPVVMVTARLAAENRAHSYTRGADHYVPKPYTPDQIFEALDDTKQWRSHAEGLDVAEGGEFSFVTSDEDETFRELSRVRSILFAKTPLDIEELRGVEEALRSLVQDAEAWGKKNCVSRIAKLSYRVSSESLSLRLIDLSGWIRDDPRPPAERWPGVVSSSRFDIVEESRDEGIVTMVKHFNG